MLDVASLTNIPHDPTNLWLMVWMIGIIGSIYAIFGGLRSVAISDTLNGFGLLLGGVLISYFGLRVVGDGNLVAGWNAIREAHPEKFNSLGRADQSVPFGTLFSGVLLLNLFYWCTNQQIIQRTLAAQGLREGQKGVLLAGFFKLLAPLILVIPGIIAFHRYGVIQQNGQAFHVQATSRGEVTLVLEAEGGELSLLHEADLKLPGLSLEAAAEQVGSTTTIDDQVFTVRHAVPPGVVIAAAADGTWATLPSADAKQAVGVLQSDKAYGTLVRDVLPEYLVGFFAAVVVGAVLSSFNSALNSTATLFSLGVYKTQIRPQAEQNDVIRAGKWFGSLVAIFAMSTAPQLRHYPTIFAYLQEMNGLYFIPLFTIVLLGMMTRRSSALAANVTALVGLAVIAIGYWIVPIFVPDFFDHLPKFHFLGIVFVGLCVLMLVLGSIWPRDDGVSPAAFRRCGCDLVALDHSLRHLVVRNCVERLFILCRLVEPGVVTGPPMMDEDLALPTLHALADRAADLFTEQYGTTPAAVVAAPGRVNLIGEHVDYNDGLVLPMAIERYVVIAASPVADRPSHHARLATERDRKIVCIPLADVAPASLPPWTRYVWGVVRQLENRQIQCPSFDALIASTVPVGAGLSSSAALEVATATMVEALTGASLDAREKALACQRAEHVAVGVPCGIMDQFSSVMGEAGHCMCIDCRSLAMEYVPLARLGRHGPDHGQSRASTNWPREPMRRAARNVGTHSAICNARRTATRRWPICSAARPRCRPRFCEGLGT